jgi:hypothetical protein
VQCTPAIALSKDLQRESADASPKDAQHSPAGERPKHMLESSVKVQEKRPPTVQQILKEFERRMNVAKGEVKCRVVVVTVFRSKLHMVLLRECQRKSGTGIAIAAVPRKRADLYADRCNMT